MFQKEDKNKQRRARHARVRVKIQGTPERPRLCVYRSLKHIYAQLIDDTKGITVVSASTVEGEISSTIADLTKKGAAKKVGTQIAQRAIKAGYKSVVFDRGGYVFTGRVAEVASGAREAGLEF